MTSMSFSSFGVRLGILHRSDHFCDLVVRDRPGTTAYKLYGARTLNDAYGNLFDSNVSGSGPVLMMTAQAGRINQSQAIIKNGKGCVDENRKGLTTFQYDITDFVNPLASPPPFGTDEETVYVRLQEYRLTAGWLAVPGTATHNANTPMLGPILLVPSALNYNSGRSFMSTMTGTAPSNTGSVAGSPPNFDETMQAPLPMHIVFSRPVDNLKIINNSDNEDTELLVSFGVGAQMIAIPGNAANNSFMSFETSQGGVSEIILASSDTNAGCPFTLAAASPNFFG